MPHFLNYAMTLARPMDEVFEFFSNASNLQRITPPELGLKILTPEPIVMGRGTWIDYQVKLFSVKMKWRTEITEWDPPHRFVDVQLRGPYREWIHTHSFVAENGGVRIEDHVQYALPLWPVGLLAFPLVRLQLGRIFRCRSEAIQKCFAGESA